jgi:hypothetical protein
MVREPGAEDHEWGFAHGGAGAPEERERAAVGADVAGCLPRDVTVVRPSRGAADRAIRGDVDAAAEIGDGITGRVVGGEALVGGRAEEEAGCVLCSRSRDAGDS